MDWRHNAACLDTDPELFFPIGSTGPALDHIEGAKVLCRQCDVTAQCLEWSLER
jgi:WhiB family transcriptional regulator, redox-sensing transcriptional regulator